MSLFEIAQQITDKMRLLRAKALPPAGLSLIRTPLGLDGLAGHHQGSAYLCFEGSNEILDWKVNLDFECDREGFHKGFRQSYKIARRDIWLKLFAIDIWDESFAAKTLTQARKYKEKNKSIYIGGYSNGGAIALLAALDFSKQGFKVNLVTWGQPKIMSISPSRIKRRGQATHSCID